MGADYYIDTTLVIFFKNGSIVNKFMERMPMYFSDALESKSDSESDSDSSESDFDAKAELAKIMQNYKSHAIFERGRWRGGVVCAHHKQQILNYLGRKHYKLTDIAQIMLENYAHNYWI